MIRDNTTTKVEVRKDYYPSGALWLETPFVNGKRHGIEKSYHGSGALMWEVPYVEGRIHGIRRGYYKSGALQCETPFVNGKVHGIVKNYDKDNIIIDCLTLYSKNRILLSLRRES